MSERLPQGGSERYAACDAAVILPLWWDGYAMGLSKTPIFGKDTEKGEIFSCVLEGDTVE